MQLACAKLTAQTATRANLKKELLAPGSDGIRA